LKPVENDLIGIKQVVRLEWMQKVVQFLLAGMEERKIRIELHEYLSGILGSGSKSERGATSRSQVVNMLMNIWVKPQPWLKEFRDDCLASIQKNQGDEITFHWSMISAAYPFWFHVAKQTGRLLALQSKVTQPQIFKRIIEQYGDRETVKRYARYVVRSFVAWGVLIDSSTKGEYEKMASFTVGADGTKRLFESSLYTNSSGKGIFEQLVHHPAFFPFQFLNVNRTFLNGFPDRIEVIHSGYEEVLLQVKTV
jgi:hypothetical protein